MFLIWIKSTALTFDICIETSGKIFSFEAIIEDSYPHLRNNFHTSVPKKSLRHIPHSLQKLRKIVAQTSGRKKIVAQTSFLEKITQIVALHLIPCKDYVGSRSALGHPVPAPTSLKSIVFSLNLHLIGQTSVSKYFTKSYLNIGAFAVNGEWGRKVVERHK